MKFVLTSLAIAFSITTYAYDPERARNNYANEIVECAAFYSISMQCVNNTNPDSPVVGQMYSAAETMLKYSVAITDGPVTDARFELAVSEQYKYIKNDCGQISLLMTEHLSRCKEISADPANGIIKWLEMTDQE